MSALVGFAIGLLVGCALTMLVWVWVLREPVE